MRAITMAVPSLAIRMEVDGADHDIIGLNTKHPYVKINGVRYPLTKDERKCAMEMTKVFSDFWRNVQCVVK